MKKLKVGIIGFGSMGSAFYKVLAGSDGYQVRAYDKLKARTRGKPHCGCCDLLAESEVVILAVKPQDVPRFMQKRAAAIVRNKALLISIAAGISTKSLEGYAKGLKVVRAMPNLCVEAAESVSFLSAGKYAKRRDILRAKKILSYSGRAIVCKESYLDKATAVSGSGPGYVFYFMNALYKAALTMGFSKTQSREVVVQTFLGAAVTAKNNGKDFQDLISRVASRGGTTEAAFKVFKSRKLDKIIIKAVKEAKKRAVNISKDTSSA